ncbi:MAG: hypothetical protein ACOCVG_01135, partial [Verrucomicrobiota bacterium]
METDERVEAALTEAGQVRRLSDWAGLAAREPVEVGVAWEALPPETPPLQRRAFAALTRFAPEHYAAAARAEDAFLIEGLEAAGSPLAREVAAAAPARVAARLGQAWLDPRPLAGRRGLRERMLPLLRGQKARPDVAALEGRPEAVPFTFEGWDARAPLLQADLRHLPGTEAASLYWALAADTPGEDDPRGL